MTQLDNNVLAALVKDLGEELGIIYTTGPADSRDMFGKSYTILGNEGERKECSTVNAYFKEPTHALWRAYRTELLHWLNGRDRIVWRCPPVIRVDSLAVLTSEIMNREAVQDNLEPARYAQYTETRCFIYSRLTAYHSGEDADVNTIHI